jgi:TolA-binding protein
MYKIFFMFFVSLLSPQVSLQAEESNTKVLLTDLEQRVNYLEHTVADLLGKIEETQKKIQDLSTQNVQVLAPAASPRTQDLVSPGQTVHESSASLSGGGLDHRDAQKLYDQGRSYLNKQAYREAELVFKDLISLHPQDPLVVNAKYWLGEIFLIRAEYDKAALHFAEAYQVYQTQGGTKGQPNNQKQSFSKAPESLLKLAFSLRGQGKKEAVCATLEQLKKEFPSFFENKKTLVNKAGDGLNCF